ncbi:uncharacterized protein LOC132787328 [Drosophila nasuta]|uniref:uncharacterized protein LOC132787328 n=1 Tax=Drosophila nasuta TaxID=42062 RepID=UPI00295EDA21|nr:uncharacterized protein LOC132787328 [Drosophila nasuta]
MYTVERRYLKTTNWVCTKYSNTRLRCPARCVTSCAGSSNSIKLSRRHHNHQAKGSKL